MIKELLGIPIYYKTRIVLSDFKLLQNHAIKHLGVKDLYALKDKFEGERYYNKFLQRSYAEIAFQSYLGESFFNLEEKSCKDFKPSFTIENKTVEVIDCSFNDLPKIPLKIADLLVVCYVNLSIREVWILGKIDGKLAREKCKKHLLSPMFRNSHCGILKDLNMLQPF